VGGVCRECLLVEIDQAIAEEHPALDRGEVFELVQEWLRAVDGRTERQAWELLCQLFLAGWLSRMP
jgi:hypothetical protein